MRLLIKEERIIGNVAWAFCVTIDEIKSPSRVDKIAIARHAVIYCLNVLLPEIDMQRVGDLVNRNRTTAQASLMVMANMMSVNMEIKNKIDHLIDTL